MKKKAAFSLIELSSVLVIIAILLALVSGGSKVVANSKLTAARSQTLSSQITAIPGLISWYEASLKNSFLDAEGIDGKQLTTWYNREPTYFQTKNNLTTSASSDVTFKNDGINNIPALNMTAAGYMATSSFLQGSLSTSTIVIVFQPTVALSSTALTIADAGASGNSTCSIGIKNNAVTLNAGTAVDTGTTNNAANFLANSNYILLAYFNGSNSQVFVNNTDTELGASSPGGGTINPGTNSLAGLTIGANKSGASGIDARISEVIVYNRILKASERKDVMNYLSKKYKINVSGI